MTIAFSATLPKRAASSRRPPPALGRSVSCQPSGTRSGWRRTRHGSGLDRWPTGRGAGAGLPPPQAEGTADRAPRSTGWRGEAVPARPEQAVLLVHAINPHGFAWSRRVTQENVDLNRNFLVDFTAPAGEPWLRRTGWAVALEEGTAPASASSGGSGFPCASTATRPWSRRSQAASIATRAGSITAARRMFRPAHPTGIFRDHLARRHQ